ncbi:SGNH/GDSL hydrolase family protein [Blastococcus sp. KM273129]|uniref:SGNH/GDSL hydrolase family protein n=1 Tax=Blastococcus sp. KM273129 TaxID=2570315 RepID=UPI001F344A1A|nr:SGNH/GDSL hydrolase family protein [Blastococcus sp. KM273129]MCF6737345.1 SGNH/GDSL hydrolase family protein [Blastococcus sp. KM273129]
MAAVALLAYLLANRPPPPGFTAPAAAGLDALETTPAAAPLRVLVVGDGATVAPEGVVAWPQLVADGISGEGARPVELTVAAADGSGYLVTPPDGQTFRQLAEGAGGDWDVVVLSGSHDDNAAFDDLQAAAQETIEAVRAASPEAAVLAVGPAWPETPAPGYVQTDRDAVAAAAEATGTTFADPLAEEWLTAPGLVGDDGETPTAEGHQALAERIRPLVEPLVPAGG